MPVKVKDPHTRIYNNRRGQRPQPLPIHSRYGTPERALPRWGMAVAHNRYKFVTASLLRRFCNGRFATKTAVRRFQKRNGQLDPEVVKNRRGF